MASLRDFLPTWFIRVLPLWRWLCSYLFFASIGWRSAFLAYREGRAALARKKWLAIISVMAAPILLRLVLLPLVECHLSP